MEEEFELTYLAESLPEGVLTSPCKDMLDIYLPIGNDHPILRVRRRGDSYEITKKYPVNDKDSSHQIENTIPLTKEEFDDFEGLPGKRVYKTRHYYKENGTTFEIDVFKEDLAGLVVVDVEFKDKEEMASFVQPDWVMYDATQTKFIAGGMLAGKKYSDIESMLNEVGYKKIEI